MYFKPQDSKLYSLAVKLKPVSRYMLTGFFIGGTIWVWLFFLYFPLSARINCANGECVVMRDRYDQLGCATKECKKIQQNINQLQATLDIYQPKDNVVNLCPISYLTHCVQKAGSKLNACRVQQKIEKDWYTQQEVILNSSGSLKQLVVLFNTLLQASQPYTCNNFSLTQSSSGVCVFSCSFLYHQVKKNNNE